MGTIHEAKIFIKASEASTIVIDGIAEHFVQKSARIGNWRSMQETTPSVTPRPDRDDTCRHAHQAAEFPTNTVKNPDAKLAGTIPGEVWEKSRRKCKKNILRLVFVPRNALPAFR